MHKKIILVSQPGITTYRIPIWNDLAKKYKLILLSEKDKAFSSVKINLSSKIKFIKIKSLYQKFSNLDSFFQFKNALKLMNTLKNNKVEAFISAADNKNIGNYLAMFWCKKRKIPFYLWGHGLYKKNLNNIIIYLSYKFLLKYQSYYITKYICYNNLVTKSLKKVSFPSNKLVTINNTLVKKNIKFSYRKNCKDIIYIGRVRDFCNLDLLFEALSILKRKKINIRLHCVGDGPKIKYFKSLAKDLKINVCFYGKIYSDSKKKSIASKCFAGVYPGNAGLSVVDYLSYSLPVIIHDDIKSHMGPEPFYIKNKFNGLHFKNKSARSLAHSIYVLYKDKNLSKKISIRSFQTFKKLSENKMSSQFINLLKKGTSS